MRADLVAGDTRPVLQLTLRSYVTKVPLNLIGMTAQLRFKIGYNPMSTVPMTIVDPVNGQVEYGFEPGDLVPGTLQYEVMVTDGSGETLTSLEIGEREVRSRLQ